MRIFERLFGSKAVPSAPPTHDEPNPASDSTLRAAIWRQVYSQGWAPETSGIVPPPVVPVSTFFGGNHEEGSIAPNVAGMNGEPGHEVFRQVLTSIEARPEVQAVLVALDPEADESMWPTSDTVYVLAEANEAQVRGWVALIKPDDVLEGWGIGKPALAPEPRPGVHVWRVWWD